MKLKKIYILIFLAISLASCSEIPVIKKLFDVKYTVSEKLKKNPPKVVAILPFENLTEEPDASLVVRRSFYGQFAPKSFVDMEILKIDSVLNKNHIKGAGDLKKYDPREIGKMLHADALIYGRVTYYKKAWRLFYSYKTVGLSAEMIDAKTGETLWMADHSKTSYGGDIPGTTFVDPISTIASLTTGPVKALWSYYLKDIEFIRTADDFNKEMVETIPEP
ncbi:MAG: hypothetical protein A2149_02005 [Candidatus Schekmanbacteria bacterium RBG_16_38_11]|uniref:Lipoprotein n=1 Tax=Candidatus Schekmanbacteria bacterium RBG_16_38_11 TaxID=1817880 RepID=A0A1F7RRM6_9BACT|nr:MAG: hypothetical protein A2149_02005 [Candidatus Schekmanbacteria bacterium RBG_16_38_11]